MDKKNAIVAWVIWFAIFQGAFLYHFLLGSGFPEGDNNTEPMQSWLWAITIGPLIMATAIRWLLIPKLSSFRPKLVAMIVGLSLAEMPIFFEIFLIGSDYPQHQIAILMGSIFCLIQFAPIYLVSYKKSIQCV